MWPVQNVCKVVLPVQESYLEKFPENTGKVILQSPDFRASR